MGAAVECPSARACGPTSLSCRKRYKGITEELQVPVGLPQCSLSPYRLNKGNKLAFYFKIPLSRLTLHIIIIISCIETTPPSSPLLGLCRQIGNTGLF